MDVHHSKTSIMQNTTPAVSGTKTLHEIKAEKETKVSELIKKCLMFFAFSNEQFAENKTPLQEGEEIDFSKDQEPEKAPEPAPEQNNNTQLSMF